LLFVKKSGLFERSEFPDFRKTNNMIFRNLGVRRHFLFTSFCCSKEVKARAARAQRKIINHVNFRLEKTEPQMEKICLGFLINPGKTGKKNRVYEI
jgi:hypothetical protein